MMKFKMEGPPAFSFLVARQILLTKVYPTWKRLMSRSERLNTLIILEDLRFEAGRDPKILNIFTTDSHHKNISVIFVTHNIFSNQKHFRTISLNCQYIILTNNPRDRLQITILAKQMFPGESVL
jgi:hypothetical protein